MSDEIKNLNQEVISMDADGVPASQLDEELLEDVAGGLCVSFSCTTYREN
jgi:hypothetical protein